MADETTDTVVAETTVVPPEPTYPRIVGKDSRSMPHPGGRVDFLVLLVQWDDTWACAYRGIGPVEFVTNSGDKLSIEEAKPHFPTLEYDLKRMNLHYGDL